MEKLPHVVRANPKQTGNCTILYMICPLIYLTILKLYHVDSPSVLV